MGKRKETNAERMFMKNISAFVREKRLEKKKRRIFSKSQLEKKRKGPRKSQELEKKKFLKKSS